MRTITQLTTLILLAFACQAGAADSLEVQNGFEILAKGARYVAKGSYRNGEYFYNNMAEKYKGTAIGAEAQFMAAECSRLSGNYSRAIAKYHRMKGEYPKTDRAQEAQYRIAWCYSQQRDKDSRLKTTSAVDLMLAEDPESPFREQALALKDEAIRRESRADKAKLDSPEGIFALAKENFDRKKYIDAMEGFKEVIYNFPGTRLAVEATFYLGECYYRTKDYQSAIDEYNRLLDDYPSSALADDAQHMIASGYLKQSPHYALDQKETTERARDAVAKFFERFPESPLAPQVKELKVRIDEKLAHKEYDAGRFYMKAKDYKSARIYFNYVVEQYPDTPWAGRSREMLSQIPATASQAEPDSAGSGVQGNAGE